MGITGLIINILIPAREGDGLEGNGLDLVDIANCEVYNGTDTIVIHSVYNGCHQSGFHSHFGHILDGLKFDIKQVSHTAMPILFLRGSVKLQVGSMKTRVVSLARKLFALRKTNPVSSRHHAVEANLLSISHSINEMRRDGRFTPGKENDHLAARLEGNGTVQNGFDVFKFWLMHIADLVSIHKTRIAHHVASVGEVHSQDGPCGQI